MRIRQAYEEDIPEIVDLLKISLGESLLPKSEAYWRWKHLKNPFGPSPVLTCWEGSTLVGVRAFMRWEWLMGETILKALRAVDTATHPAYQGKGIFRTLTEELVKECIQNGEDFIFNTPNSKSKPGYLKMGWREAGVLPVEISPRRPFRMLKNIVLSRKATHKGPTVPTDSVAYYLNHEQLPALLN